MVLSSIRDNCLAFINDAPAIEVMAKSISVPRTLSRPSVKTDVRYGLCVRSYDEVTRLSKEKILLLSA